MTVRSHRVTIKGTLHALLSILTWILFAYWWKKVIPQTAPDEARTAFLAIVLTALVTSILTLLWVRHNLAIFRRKGPRKSLPPVSEELTADRLGRRLERPGAEFLAEAPMILVSLHGDGKRFEIPRVAESLDGRPGFAHRKGERNTFGIPQGA